MKLPDHLNLSPEKPRRQEAIVRTACGTTIWFKIGIGVHQGWIFSPCLFNLHTDYIMWNARVKDKEGWMQKNWCFWIVVLQETLESPLDCREIKPINQKGNQSWIFIGRTDAKAKAPIFWLPDVKSQLTGKGPWCWERLRQEKKWVPEDDMLGWRHRLYTQDFEQALGDSEGQGSLACYRAWNCKGSEMTQWLNCNKNIFKTSNFSYVQ